MSAVIPFVRNSWQTGRRFYLFKITRMNSWIRRVEHHHGFTSEAILATLEAAICSGQVRIGDVLPSQRLMADFMGVHVNTVNRAMREAARLGLVTARSRRGTTVIAQPET